MSTQTQEPATPTRPRRPSVESRDPATGEIWREWPETTPEEVRRAVAAARAAQPAWAARPVRERARHVERFRRALYRRRLDVAAMIERENGKPAPEALAVDVLVTLDVARFTAREAPRLLGERRFTPKDVAHWRKRVRIAHEPYGVIGVIAPWNYPLMLPASTVLAAVAGGNAVVVKPSEYTPTVGMALAELCREAGLPEGVVAVLPGGPATGSALVEAGVDKLFFTGSSATGRKVAMACAERMIPCVLELGGSDPAIVLDDAPLDNAVSGILWGRFSNAGQTCVAPKRVIVADAVHDRFVQRISGAVARLDAGAGGEVNALIRPWQVAHLRAQLDDALARGARIVAQGAPHPEAGDGYFPPTVLVDVTPEMQVMREESFGPLLPVLRVRDDDEAVARANASMYGLSASVWSRDAARAMRVAERVEAGSVHINDALTGVGMSEVPHGGVKGSGTGRTHGTEGLLECVRSKTIITDRLPGVRQPWWFGYGEEHARNLDAYARLAHGGTLAERASGVWRSVRMTLGKRREL